MYKIVYYKTLNNKIPYLDWYNSLNKSLKIEIDKRLSKVERGLVGFNKRLSEDLYELKFTNGIRIYYTETNKTIIILFTGGNKTRQNKDIESANKYLNEYKERKNNEF